MRINTEKSITTIINRIKNYFEFVSALRIQYEREYINFDLKFQNLGEAIYYMQIFSMFLRTHKHFIQHNEQVVDFIQNVTSLSRPYSFFQNYSFQQYSFLFPLLLILGIEAHLVYKKIYYDQKVQTILEYMESQNNISYLIMKIHIYMTLTYQKIVYVIFIELAGISLFNSIYSIQSLSITFFSVMAIFISIAVYLVQLLFYTPNLFNLNFSIFNLSLLNYIEPCIVTVTVLLNCVQYDSKLQTLGICTIIFYLLRFVCLFYNFEKFYGQQKFEILIVNFCIIFTVLITLGDLKQVSLDMSLKSLLLIILWPLISQILLIYLKYNHQGVLMQRRLTIQESQYKIITLKECLDKKIQIPPLILVLLNVQNQKLSEEYEQNFSNTETLIYWIQEENLRFYKMITQLRNKSERLKYYLCFLRVDYLISLNQIRIKDQGSPQFQTMHSINVKSGPTEKFTDNNFSSDLITKTGGKSSLSIKELQFQNLNFFESLRLKIIKESVQNSSRNMQNSKEQEQIELHVKLFVQYEETNKNVVKKILKSLNSKINFQQCLIDNKFEHDVYTQIVQVIDRFQRLENMLQNLYYQFPSKKMQTYLVFYYCEIYSNYLMAYKFTNFISMSDENLIKLQTNQNFDLFTDDINFAIINLDEVQRPKLESHSRKLHQFFEMRESSLNKITYLEQLLPKGFEQMHQELINQYVITGQSKYFRTINNAFFQANRKYMTQFSMFFDRIQNNNNNNQHIVFFKSIINNDAVILVGGNFRIINITSKLADIFGISTKYVEELALTMKKQSINWFIPSFRDQVEKEIQYYNLNFTTQDTIFNIYTNDVFRDNDANKRMDAKYTCDLLVNIRQLAKGQKYFLIFINKAKIYQRQDREHSLDNDSSVPLEGQQAYVGSDKVLNQKPASNQLKFNQRRSIHFLPEITSFSSPRNEALFILQQEINQSSQRNTPKQRQQIPEIEEEIGSSSDHLQSENSILEKNFTTIFNHKYQEQEQIKDEIGSQASSIAGIRQSRFYKKYELVQKYQYFPNGTYYLEIFTILFLILLTSGVGQSLLYIISANKDFPQYMEDIDMIQMKQHFLGPMDQYILCLGAILTQQTLLGYGLINQTEFVQRLAYSSFELPTIFNTLKTNYVDLVNNNAIAQFLQNEIIQIGQKNGTQIAYQNVSFHEALILLLESSYNFEQIDPYDPTTFDLYSNYLIYMFGNYLVFHERFDEINVGIVESSLNRSNVVQYKWSFIFYPCLAFCVLCYIISQRFYTQHILCYLRIISLFKYNIMNNVVNELDRLKSIQKLVKKDSQMLQQYRFDIFDRERQFNKRLDNKEKVIKSPLKYKKGIISSSKLKLINIPKLILFNCSISFIIFVMYFIFICINYVFPFMYYQKYSDTANYFNNLSAIVIYSCETFVSKSFVYQINAGVWYFFNDTDRLGYLEEFNKSHQAINNFLQTQMNLDSLNILATNTYKQKFTNIMNDDVCLQIENVEIAAWFCDQAFGGALRRGYQAAASTILASQLNEYVLTKQFSQSPGDSMSIQFEAGLIMTSAMEILQKQLLVDIKSITNDLSYNTLAISGVYIAIIVPLTIIFLFFLRYHYKSRFQYCLKSICLLPQASLFLDSSIDIELRQMAISFKME